MEAMITQYWKLPKNEKEIAVSKENEDSQTSDGGGPTEKREDGTRDREDGPNIFGGTMDWSHETYLVRWLLGVTITLLAVAGVFAFRVCSGVEGV